MGIKSNTLYKGFIPLDIYVKFKGLKIESVTTDEGNTFLAYAYFSLYTDENKTQYIEDFLIMYKDTDMASLTITRMWEEVKLTYDGIDVI